VIEFGLDTFGGGVDLEVVVEVGCMRCPGMWDFVQM